MRLYLGIIYLIVTSLSFGQDPNWQDDPGAYEFTASMTAQIEGHDSGEGDILAAFDASGNVRGVGSSYLAPFGPYTGQTLHDITLRANSEGDALTFKLYDISEDEVINISESYTFVINEAQGDLVEPVLLSIGSSGGENQPDWQDQPGAYEFTASMTALVLDHEYGSGDILAAFDSDNNVRGVGSSYAAPFGTYSDQILHDITLRSNSEGDQLLFKLYDISEDQVLNISETYSFVINDTQGDLFNPVELTAGGGFVDCFDDDSLVSPFTCATAIATFT